MSTRRTRPVSQSPSVLDTRERILDAAARLFTAHGFAGTSIRMITGDAGVPVALVNYHFGSKRGLMEAVMERALGRHGGTRLNYLEKLERDAGEDKPVPVKTLVETFLSSALRLTRRDDLSGTVFKQLVARAFYEPGADASFFPTEYAETIERYVQAFRRALPHLNETDVVWRVYFMVGLVAYVIAGKDTMRITQQYGLDGQLTDDPAQVLDRLVPFLVAGFAAPPP